MIRVKNVIAAIEALHLACSPRQINRSFLHSGLIPFDVNQALRNPRINPSEVVTIDDRKRKGIQMDGIVVTSEFFLEELRNNELQRQTPSKRKKQ
jgi:hypothetical protein